MNPSSSPTATPIAKPAIVVQKVFHACPAIGPAYSTSARTMATGPGKMNSETSKVQTTACQATVIAMVRIQGASCSRRCRSIASAPADEADLLAHLVDDVDEGLRVGDFEI